MQINHSSSLRWKLFISLLLRTFGNQTSAQTSEVNVGLSVLTTWGLKTSKKKLSQNQSCTIVIPVESFLQPLQRQVSVSFICLMFLICCLMLGNTDSTCPPVYWKQLLIVLDCTGGLMGAVRFMWSVWADEAGSFADVSDVVLIFSGLSGTGDPFT